MLSISLHGTWDLRDPSSPASVIPAPVPGSVHDALLAAGLLPDAHHAYNERDQMWVGDRTWIYSRDVHLAEDFLAHHHADLIAEGLDTFCEIRINGETLARTDNMLRPWRFPAKHLLRPGTNTIELRFSPASEAMRHGTAKRHLPAWNEFEPHHTWGPVGRGYVRKQACQFGWDWGPQCPSAGPWLPIRFEAWSLARIADWRLEQTHLPSGDVRIAIYTKPNTGTDLAIRATLSLHGKEVARIEEPFWGGHEWNFTLAEPALWWPNGMGNQPLYNLSIQLLAPDGTLLDSRCARIGLRHLELVRQPDSFGRSFFFLANGRPFFAKGSNWIPLDAHPSAQNLEPRYRRDLLSAKAAHMNMLRVWGGGYFSHDAFYDLCDELGILVWQDLMFGCGTYPTWDETFLESVRQETALQARRLRHHACLACWCGNNELEMGFADAAWKANDPAKKAIGKMAWASYLELFERVLPSALALADPTTPYLRGSPHSAPEDGRDGNSPRSGDFHLWEVWFTSAPCETYRKNLHRFLSEFGFQSFPDAAHLKAFAPDKETLSLESPWLAYRQHSQPGNARIAEIVADWFGKNAVASDFPVFCTLSQIAQGLTLKTGIEFWRTLFPRCGGTTYWQINDRWAAPTWATLDHAGRWKASHHLARAFFSPLLVIGIEDAPQRTIRAVIANDLPHLVPGRFTLTVTDCTGNRLGGLARSIEAAGLSHPTEIGVFDVAALTPRGHPTDDTFIWLAFTPNDPALPPSENLALFARPRSLKLAAPELAFDLQPTGRCGESILNIRTGQTPALWVHLRRSMENLPWTLEEEFFHLAPNSSRSTVLRHQGFPTPADIPLTHIADLIRQP